MELFSHLAIGVKAALSLQSLLYCFFGVTLGTFIGVLPGIGPLATIAMLMPLTFTLEPMIALIFLAGIYYGALYGGSTASILLRLPGTAASAVICLDGNAMARQGRANAALVMTTVASFFGGCLAVLVIAAFSPPLARFAIGMGPSEYTALMVFGVIAAAAMSEGSFLKGMAMVLLGMIAGLVGMDIDSGILRYTFGSDHLANGVSIVALAMGLFGVAEVMRNLMSSDAGMLIHTAFRMRDIWPERDDMNRSWWPMTRGAALGSIFGILPGAGPVLSSFASYSMEKQISADPSRFGNGAIEGVVGPEASNNAAAQTSFIPTLTLGIPGDAVMALMLAVLMVHGINPGPNVMSSHPDLFWGLVVSFWVGNVMLMILNLPLIGIWLKMVSIPYRLLFPAIMVFICIGIYSANNNVADLFLVALLGLVGVLFASLRCDPAPLILGFILGPMLEEYARRALLFSRGDLSVFVKSPLSATLLAGSVVLLVSALIPNLLPSIYRSLSALTKRRKAE